ncbi:MAG: HAMP domain-containing protein, partial [Acidobacteriota bacterium]
MLLLIILLPSILPLVVSSVVLIQRNRETLKTQQQELLTHSAQQFVGALSETLARQRVQIEQLGRAIVAAPITQDRAGDGGTALEARLREPWVEALLGDFVREQRFVSFAALTQDRVGMRSSNAHEPQIDRALIEAFDTALRLGEPAYRFATLSQGGSPVVATAVPIPTIDGQDVLVVQALLPIDFERASSQQAFEVDDFFLVDADGELLWTGSRQERVQQALLNSPVVEDFARNPLLTTVSELTLDLGDSKMPILARVVQVRETGWGLVAHKAKDVAFQQVSNMVFEAFLASLLAIMLALFFAIIATRWFSRPFQRLANASHEIAAGKFDRRVPLEGLATREVAELAGDFNRMGDYVQNYIEQLRRAAEANRALFISSIRAFAAAIDAKDPYTRGHSERVAAYSRSISVYLGLPKDMQEKVWISGV